MCFYLNFTNQKQYEIIFSVANSNTSLTQLIGRYLMSKPANEPNLDDLQDKVMEYEIGKERQQQKIKRIDNGNKFVRRKYDQCLIEKLKSMSSVKPSVDYSVVFQDYRQIKFAESVLSGIEMLISKYANESNAHLIIGGNGLKKIWLDGQVADLGPLPHSLADFTLMLCEKKPSTIVYVGLMPYMHVDAAFGFGLYLFDESDNLISKLVYKFFDESIAPEDAFRLNTPTTFTQLDDNSRPFF